MKTFNAKTFLEELIDDVASSVRERKRFDADPYILGPLLISLRTELLLLINRQEAICENALQVTKTEDDKYRVSIPTTKDFVVTGKGGFDTPGEALDATIRALADKAFAKILSQ